MDSALSYFTLLLCGAGVYGLFRLWSRAIPRWAEWRPSLKNVAKGGLLLVSFLLVMFTLSTMFAEGRSPGVGFFFLILGSLAPGMTQKYLAQQAAAAQATPQSGNAKPATVLEELRAKLLPVKLAGSVPVEPFQLTLGNTALSASDEVAHLLISGARSADKALAFGELIEKLRVRGDTAIVVDAGGDMVGRHFQADTDFVFNPYDARCVSWTPLLEMADASQASALARSIVPDGLGADREAHALAQTFAAALLHKLFDTGQLTLERFLHMAHAPEDELLGVLQGTPAADLLDAADSLALARATLQGHLTGYSLLLEDGEPFSIGAMVQAEHSGVLFATYRDDHLDELRPLLGTLVDVAARSILALDASEVRRVWLIVDDLAGLGRVQSLEAFQAKAYKVGGCLVVGLHTLGALKTRYGRDRARALMEGLGARLVLRAPDVDTANATAQLLGDLPEPGETEARQQVQALTDRQGWLKLPAEVGAKQVSLTAAGTDGSQKAFVARNFKDRPMLQAGTLSAETAGPARQAPALSQAAAPVVASVSGPTERFEPQAVKVQAGDDEQEVALRAQRVQEQLRQRAQELGIGAWTQGEYDEGPEDVDASASEQNEERDDMAAPSSAQWDTGPVQEQPLPLTPPGVEFVVAEPVDETPFDKPQAPARAERLDMVERLDVIDVTPKPLEQQLSQAELAGLQDEQGPVELAPTPASSEVPCAQDAAVAERPTSRTGDPARQATKGPRGEGARKTNPVAAPVDESISRTPTRGPRPEKVSQAPQPKPAKPVRAARPENKGGKAHDMLKDLLS